MIILTLNCGSSSVKYQLYDWSTKTIMARGGVERVTVGGSFISHTTVDIPEIEIQHECPDHTEAIQLIMDTLVSREHGAIDDLSSVQAVGHRVVHGSDKFAKSIIINDEVIATFEANQHLAPLHVPANLKGIEGAMKVLPNAPHCAIMDTAWHQTMPDSSFMYALPYEWYTDYGVRRYGFHGTSFLYCAKRAAVLLGKDPFDCNLIICHVGNGSSVCAVKNGTSLDTSMGLTPLEGLVMGTRSGDCDPAIGAYMARQTGKDLNEIDNIMNRQSGLLGITGDLVDRRDIVEAAEKGNARAKLAVEMESYRIKKYIGAYTAALGHVDAIIFTAGVGERQPTIRGLALCELENLGIRYDEIRNQLSMTRNAETRISTDDSPVQVLVIPTDEELVMTEDTFALTEGNYDVHTAFSYSFQDREYRNLGREESFKTDMEKYPGIESIVVDPA
ncbi:MAG: acetate kinase [Spirochaetales bacterium]|nr:acetate kinase [Spirochaetales bacterium]